MKELPTKINVVGNALSLLSKELGSKIDEYPTLRFNSINQLDPLHQGTRWDFIATSNIKTINFFNQNPPKFHTLLWTRWNRKDDRHLEQIKFGCDRIEVPFEVMDSLAKVYNRPSTGLTALWYLDNLNIDCNIYGFDWKETKTYYNSDREETIGNKPHNYDVEKQLCLELIEKNNWTIY